MRLSRLLTFTVLVSAAFSAAALAAPGTASAVGCSYDEATRTLVVDIDAGPPGPNDWRSHSISRRPDAEGGAIELWSWGFEGGRERGPCAAATVANTDIVEVVGERSDIEDNVIIEQASTTDARATDSSFSGTGIVFRIGLGSSARASDPEDDLEVHGGGLADDITIGMAGIALDRVGTSIVHTGSSVLDVDVRGGYGNDRITAEGSASTGPSPTVPLLLDGDSGRDVVVGGRGADMVSGDVGDDIVTGGPGADSIYGGPSNDTLRADDGEADAVIDGGNHTDTAYYDPAVDPQPIGVETLVDPTLPPPPPAGPCVFDAGARKVSAQIAAGAEATLRVVAGEIWFGQTPVACGGATTTNTDTITVSGPGGSVERLTIDGSAGPFAPGATAEADAFAEIEIAANLGDAGDVLVLRGTAGDDAVTVGQRGLALNTDADIDVTFALAPLSLEVHGLGGRNTLSGSGGYGSGGVFLGALALYAGDAGDMLTGGNGNDRLYGGAAADTLQGGSGNDQLSGAGGNDILLGSHGDDELIGGAGSDSFSAAGGNDMLRADDGEADSSLNGGPDTDTAHYDPSLDAAPISVETKIGSEPPPPAGPCVFDAGARRVSTTVEAGGEATLRVVAGEIWFGPTPIACGGATTGNTDTITVSGAAGSVERLTIDGSSGAFAPGATAEADAFAEIEIAANLGDAGDAIVVLGTEGDDAITVGQKGVALNTDADVDVTFGVVPLVLEVHGAGGRNVLTGSGGYGSGTVFLGSVVLYAGDAGDTLTGGNGNDRLYGGAAVDTLQGASGNDSLSGAGDNDTLLGSHGDDELIGGAGSDSLWGAGGNDTLRADDGEADSSLNGGPDTDTAHYDGALDPTPVSVETSFPV